MQYCKKRINVLYDQVYEKEENNNIMIRIMSNILESRNSESREHMNGLRLIRGLFKKNREKKSRRERLIGGVRQV